MDDRLNELAALAELEEWDYHRTETDNQKPILYNYLRYTYQRLTEEEKIVVSDDGQFITRFSHFQKLIGSSSGALGRRRDRQTARPEY